MTLENFGRVVCLLGDLVFPDFIKNVQELAHSDYFHGNISRQDSIKLLSNKAEGHYLIRISGSNGNELVISFTAQGGNVQHIRLGKPPYKWRNFRLLQGEATIYKELKAFLNIYKDRLKYACPKIDENAISMYDSMYLSFGTEDDSSDISEEEEEFTPLNKFLTERIKTKLKNQKLMSFSEFCNYLRLKLSKEVSNLEETNYSQTLVSNRAAKFFKMKLFSIPSLLFVSNNLSFFQSICFWWYKSDLNVFVEQKKTEVLKWLLEKGVEIQCKQFNGKTFKEYYESKNTSKSWSEYLKSFAQGENWVDEIILYATCYKLKVNIVILTDFENDNYSFLIESNRAKRHIILALINGRYFLPIFSNLFCDEIHSSIEKKKKETRHK